MAEVGGRLGAVSERPLEILCLRWRPVLVGGATLLAAAACGALSVPSVRHLRAA